eukprot:g1641.t1
MERGRRGRGGPQRGRFAGGRDSGRGRGRGRGQEGWESVTDGKTRNAASLEHTHEIIPRQFFAEGRLARRPDSGGKVGRPIEVFANFFILRCGLQRAFHYDVDIKQAGSSRLMGEGDTAPIGQQLLPTKLCRSIVNTCAQQQNWSAQWVYDGKKNIYSPIEIFPKKKTVYSVDISGDSGRERVFEVGVQLAASVNVLDLNRYLQQGDIAIPRDVIQLIEVCLRFSASNDPHSYLTGRSVYFDDPTVNHELPGGSELLMGYHQGVKICQNGLMLNVETTCTAFLKQRPVLEMFEELLGGKIRQNFRLDQRMYNKLRNSITSIMVTPTHNRSSRKYRCIGLTDKSAAEMSFPLKDGSSCTVKEYWEQRYGALRFPQLPCLDVSRGKKINYLPPEVCQIAPGQRLDHLSEDQTRETIRFSAQKPMDRKQNILEILRKANINNDASCQEFGISVNSDMTKTAARVLPQPHLQYQRPESMDTGTRGSWNLEGVRFFKPAELKSWAIVSCLDRHIALQQGEQGLLVFVESMMMMLSEMGISLPQTRPPLVHQMQDTVKDSLVKAMGLGEAEFHHPVDFVLVVLSRKEPYPYQDFKRVAEGALGVVTQCIVARNAGIGSPPKGRKQYLANLAMKINQKLGGVNTQITGNVGTAFPVLGQRKNRPFIVFGADVTHPTSFNKSDPSVGAIVASMDPFLGQFAAKVLTMPHREEKMSMKESIRDLFLKFYTRNRVKPEGVFLYRDGVSEGQFQNVFEHEYNEIRAACNLLDSEYNPPITIVLVQKRHHTRLFPTSPQSGDNKDNVLPGTVLDSAITSKFDFDFYLNSHSGIQGTNRPAHYYVLVDENGFGSDGIQLFSYWMCYLYCRCTRSVSYAPPAYYAHLAAVHGRYLVSRESDSSSEGSNNGGTSVFNAKLDDKMFFI